jgi:hypothetical protein
MQIARDTPPRGQRLNSLIFLGGGVGSLIPLDMCAELKPTVLLLDLHMPGEQFEVQQLNSRAGQGRVVRLVPLCAQDVPG